MRSKLLSLPLILAGVAGAQTTTGWKLVWSDEFNGVANTPPNPANWNYDLGNGTNGWGNGEAENYTNSIQNAYQDGKGNLVIAAIRTSTGAYTSARLQTGAAGASTHTTDLNWQYGLIVARIKLPFGQGVWPAFWMLGEDLQSVDWPACGEIDIMENFGAFHNNIDLTNGTVHGPIATGSTTAYNAGGQYQLPYGERVNTDYHVYAVEWAQDSVAFYVDGHPYYTATPSAAPAGQWKLNHPFFILLNLAIGGPSTFLGRPDPNSAFSNQQMLVDYVRVYQSTPVSAVTPVISPGRVVNAASLVGAISPGGLGTLYGKNLSDGTPTIDASRGFPISAGNVTVSLNGVKAPLIYVSPTQINFQAPWEVAPGTLVPVVVTRDDVPSAPENITIAAPQAPSVFLSEYVNGVAWATGTGCEATECAVRAGSIYQLWANALGPKNGPLQDGQAAIYDGSLAPLEVPGGPASCQLTIGGMSAAVQYCGAAPGQIIDQINFVYPAGVSSGAPYVDASLTINGVTGYFRVPAPAVQQ